MEGVEKLTKEERKPEKDAETAESKLSSEQRECFENLLAEASKKHQGLLETRKQWLEMKKAGKPFEEFISFKLKQETGPDFYSYLLIYESLGYKKAVATLSEVLNRESVWNDIDGSNAFSILRHFGELGDQEALPAIIKFIENSSQEQYRRNPYWWNDMIQVVAALRGILGAETPQLLELLAENEKTFSGWWAAHKNKFLSEHSPIKPPPKLEFKEFDAELEERRIKELEEKLSEHKEAEKRAPSVSAQSEKPSPPKRWRLSEQILEQNARNWEQSELVNFYGRFRPKLENAVEISKENYLSGLWATLQAGLEKESDVGREEYLNFLSGVMRPEFAKAAFPSKITSPDIYRISALAIARAFSTGILENRANDAVSEIEIARIFLDNLAKTTEDLKERAFIQKMSREISATQGFIAQEQKPANLSESAEAFMLYHHNLKRAREIPDFRTLLAEKIRWYLANDLSHNLREIELAPGDEYFLPKKGPSLSRLREIAKSYFANCDLYESVENSDVPLYWEAKEKLEYIEAERAVIFGRDGRYFFTALKAGDLGFGKKELKYVIITRSIKEGVQSGGSLDREKVIHYLNQNGATLDFTFIDTGYEGSIPEFAIKLLANAGGIDLSRQAIDQRIKLLASKVRSRGELSRKSRRFESGFESEQEYIVNKIEGRPQSIDSPSRLIMDEKGVIKPEAIPTSVSQQLQAWIVEHAVMRNFAPRLDAEKRIKYLRSNPLKGYKFIQEYRGGYIGSHPLQLWESETAKEKVLLKGGPAHALRADFVGQRFLVEGRRSFGSGHLLKIPKTELVNTDEGLKLKIEFLEGWQRGSLNLPEKDHDNFNIQGMFLIDALLGKYDRTPWNLMFRGPDVAFIDNGACLFSRARGGYKAFPEHFDIEQLQEILANPQFPGKPVNEAYHNLIQVEGGQIKVKNYINLESALATLNIGTGDNAIDDIIEEAGIPDGRRSVAELQERIKELEKTMDKLAPDSPDYKKTKAAIETHQKAVEAGGEATYLKKALRQRRDDIGKMFKPFVKALAG